MPTRDKRFKSLKKTAESCMKSFYMIIVDTLLTCQTINYGLKKISGKKGEGGGGGGGGHSVASQATFFQSYWDRANAFLLQTRLQTGTG